MKANHKETLSQEGASKQDLTFPLLPVQIHHE